MTLCFSAVYHIWSFYRTRIVKTCLNFRLYGLRLYVAFLSWLAFITGDAGSICYELRSAAIAILQFKATL